MVSIRIPGAAPRVSPSVGGTPQFEAQRVIPQQNAGPEQMAQAAQGVQQAGAGFLRAANHLQDLEDDAKSLTLRNEFRERLAGLETQAQSLRGLDALDKLPAIEEQIEKLREEYDAKPENGNQARLFQRFADERQANARLALNSHRVEQARVAKIGALAAAEEGSVVDYQNHWRDPENGPLYKATAVDAVRKRGAIEGWDEQRIKNAVLDTTTKMHAGVLDTLARQPGVASDYLAANRSEIAPDVAAKAQRIIDNASVTETATRAMFQAVAWAEDKGVTTTQKERAAKAAVDLAYQNGEMNAEQWKATMSMVDARFMDRRQQEGTALMESIGAAEKFLLENKQLGLGAMDPALRDALVTGGAWGRVQNFAEEGRWSTDPAVYERIRGMTREEHLKIPDAEFEAQSRLYLNNADWSYAKARRREMLGTATGGDYYDTSRSDLVDRGARALGILTDTKNTIAKAAERRAREDFGLAVDAEASRLEGKLNRKLTDEEYQKVIDNRVLALREKVVVEQPPGLGTFFLRAWTSDFGSITAGARPVYNEMELGAVPPAQKDQVFVNVGGKMVSAGDVPTPVFNKLRDLQAAANQPQTIQAIVDRWYKMGQPMTLDQ